jgi:hypothetical protein
MLHSSELRVVGLHEKKTPFSSEKITKSLTEKLVRCMKIKICTLLKQKHEKRTNSGPVP